MRFTISRLSCTLLLFYIFSNFLISQEEYPSGKPIIKIYAGYGHHFSQEANQNRFNIEKAYFGYNLKVDEHLSSQVLIETRQLPLIDGDNERYILLRNAQLKYTNNKLSVTVGLADGMGHKVPKDYWAKRYLFKPYLLNYKYVNIADAGIIVEYRMSKLISIDAAVLNGEGHTNISWDNNLLYSAGITITPADGMAIRLYSDICSRFDSVKNTIATFLGYNNSMFSFGIEASYKSDFDWIDGHNIYGFSSFAGYKVLPYLELFVRYDKLSSVDEAENSDPWNIEKDGSMIIGGLQYIYSSNLKLSLNYRRWSPDQESLNNSDIIQFNLGFKF